jgi:signal transduction histidine kinase
MNQPSSGATKRPSYLPNQIASFEKRGQRLRVPGPVLRNWHFWAAQAAVIALAVVHYSFEINGLTSVLGNFYFLPISLFWAPVIYVALTFGFASAITTAALTIAVSIPNFVIWHQGPARFWEIADVVVVASVAILLGYIVEQKRAAQTTAKLSAHHALRAHEEERQRISRELHDGTIQSMIGICQQLDAIRYLSQDLPSSVSSELADARKSVVDTVDNLRNFISDLRPTVLDGFGAVASIRRLLSSLAERTGVKTEFKSVGKRSRLSAERESCIFRIVQEVLRNIERHSGATRIEVTIAFSTKEITLDICDNGVGFQIPQSFAYFPSYGKFGLLGILEYTELLSGKLEIDSKPGKGTRIKVLIPQVTD